MRQVMNFNNVEKIHFAMPPNNSISRIGNYFIRKIIIWTEVGGDLFGLVFCSLFDKKK